MATKTQLVDLDSGPNSCILVALWNSFNELAEKPTFRSFFLGFSQSDLTFKHRAAELLELLDMFNEKSVVKKEMHGQLITQSVAGWIFSSNRISFAGTDTIGETENLITSQVTFAYSETKKKEVMQTFGLLKQTYSSRSELAIRQISLEELNSWHKILFSGIIKHPGQFRKFGVLDAFATSSVVNDCKHVYPHHQIVKHAVNVLCRITNFLTNEIDQATSPQDKLVFTFALAAFVQFHVVDVHPYADGNGRLSRFLSKYYLDAVLPLPCPMFKIRNSYLPAIINARNKEAPGHLMLLLLDTAISLYKEAIQILSRSHDKFLYATSSEEFTESMEVAEVLQEDRPFLVAEFEKLVVGVHELTSPTSGKVYSVKKEQFIVP